MSSNSTHKLSFHGSGGQLFGIQIVNLLLTIITLGIYFPWARAKVLKYLYSEVEFFQSRFAFHGTGKELFMGFLKIIGIFIVIVGIYIGCFMTGNFTIIIIGIVFYMISIFSLIPLAIHGSLRYRLSRSSWRGIHFGYRGNLKEFYLIFLKGIGLSMLTLGIYFFWFSINIRKYVFNNIRLGNVTFSFTGNGKDYFLLNLKGFVLTILTLGIYMFWYLKDIYSYFVNHIKVHQGEETFDFKSSISGSKVFVLYLTNMFLILFTLGFGISWVIVRQLNFFFNNIELVGDFNPDAVLQTEEDYKNAAGENISDFMDIGLV